MAQMQSRRRGKLLKKKQTGRALESGTAEVSDFDDEASDDGTIGDVDERLHGFGMPGYGTSRAWQELQLFFAERVRINKAKTARAQRRRARIIRRRESDHIKRVQRRKNARSRSAHARLVARHRATEKVLAERTRRAQLEACRISDAHDRQHLEDVSWIQSSNFSPRARAEAYDGMRRLAYSATPNAELKGRRKKHRDKIEKSGSHISAKAARPQSASPRLRNKQNATAVLLDGGLRMRDDGKITNTALDISRISSSRVVNQGPASRRMLLVTQSDIS